jgi:phenylacetate-CoA ligase
MRVGWLMESGPPSSGPGSQKMRVWRGKANQPIAPRQRSHPLVGGNLPRDSCVSQSNRKPLANFLRNRAEPAVRLWVECECSYIVFMLDVATTVNGTIWPGIPGPFASQLLAMQCQFEATQWLEPEVLLQRQTRQLSRLIKHAYDTSPFYRDRLESVGLSPSNIRGPQEWQRIPLLTRVDLQVHFDQIRSNQVPPEHGPQSELFTSGSTGRPVRVVGTGVTQLFWNCCTLRDHLWHRRGDGGVLAAIRSFAGDAAKAPDGASAPDWGAATRGLVNTGASHSLNIHSTIGEQAAWLQRIQPDYLLTYPSNLLALIEDSQAHGWRLPRLRQARTFGELLEPRVRKACQAAWGIKVVDMYSSQEVGYIALQCPDSDRYHVQSENVLVEVLDDAGRPCSPGQIGRVVVTAMHNFALPLLRYDIGDFAEVAPRCSCGRGLPALERIVGRQRNMLQLPNGERRWPSIELANTGEIADFPPIHQFQLIQRSLTSLELLLVAARPLTPAEEQKLRGWVLAAAGYPFDVTIRYVDSIPRSSQGKFEDFRSELDPIAGSERHG